MSNDCEHSAPAEVITATVVESEVLLHATSKHLRFTRKCELIVVSMNAIAASGAVEAVEHAENQVVVEDHEENEGESEERDELEASDAEDVVQGNCGPNTCGQARS